MLEGRFRQDTCLPRRLKMTVGSGGYVFRAHGAAWRKANAGHMSLAKLKVMSAIET